MPSLLDYLSQLQSRGQSHVYLDDDARGVLRTLYQKARNIGTPQPKPAVAAVAEASRLVAEPETKPAETVSFQVTETSGNKSQRLTALQTQLDSFPKSDSLRDTLVFSTGNPEARIMLVGEAPGFEEERHLTPFVGPAGQKLNGILKAMGLTRDDVYITNTVKFRPVIPNQKTGNRRPTTEEIQTFLNILKEEISIVGPEVIVALGSTAIEALTGGKKPVSGARGQWFEFQSIPVRASYHPSYLLHNEKSIKDKRAVWEDMLAVMERLNLPISEKQRGYFKSAAS